MKIPKITKILPLALALMMTTSGVMAATEAVNDSQTAVYQLQLAEFFDIELTTVPATSSTVSFTGNYTAIEIDNALEGVFQVVSNTNTKDVYLYGECEAGGKQEALYGSPDNLRIILTNQKTASTPAAVAAIKAGGLSTNSPNAIAFKLTTAYTHTETPTDGFLEDPTLTDGNVKYTIANGKHTFSYTLDGGAVDNSFSTMDTDGMYKATLTLSDAPL